MLATQLMVGVATEWRSRQCHSGQTVTPHLACARFEASRDGPGDEQRWLHWAERAEMRYRYKQPGNE